MNEIKKLKRSSENKMIAGVCAGVAEYFAVDVTLVRVIWALFSFGWGVGVLAYIVCLFVMPQE